MADPQRSLERLWPAGLALLAAAGIGVGLHFLGRGLNRPPVVVSVDIEPPTVPPGGSARVRVAAEDPDGDALSFAFRAEHGRVEVDPGAHEAQYRAAAQGPIADRLTVTVTDARGLSTTASHAVTLSGALSGPTATPVPTVEPEKAGAPTLTPPSTFAPPAVTLPPTPSARPSATPRPKPRLFNRAPVVQGGTNFFGVEVGMVGLAATGYDPDGDPVTHKWELGSCVVVENQTKETADVKLAAGCDSANIALVWTDSHGASGRTEWNLLKGEQ